MDLEVLVLERELKLVVTPELELCQLDDAVPGAELRPPEQRAISDTYHDTADFRLARWGCTLRYREGDGWTAKVPTPASGRILAREEITVDGDPDTPPTELLALVRSLTRGEPVDVVARFTTERTANTWLDADGAMVAELADDRVTVETPAGHQEWRELEIELGPDTANKVAKRIAKRIRKAAATGPRDGQDDASGDSGTEAGSDAPIVAAEHRPKLVRAIGAAAEADPDVVEIQLSDQPTCRDVVAATIARSVTRLLLHLPAARLGVDVEGVHQARVATRRLRSDLRTFGPLLDPTWAGFLGEQLRWLADDLGQIRDTDVLLARLQSTIEANPALAGVATNRVLLSLQRQRKRHIGRLVAELDSERADQLLDQLVDAAVNPRTTGRADDPATDRLGALVAKRWRRLDRAITALGDPPTSEDLHRVRILAKRVRYATEATDPVYGGQARGLVKAVAAIQDTLGDLNDAAVAEAWLAALAERTKGDTAFSAGRLCQAISSDALAGRERWRKQVKQARKAAAKLDWLT